MNAPNGPPPFLATLNANQRAAAEHVSGPLLVIAGAGTGKTKTLAARVAALIQGGVIPGRILLLTFTRRAAGEMIRRAGQVVGESCGSGRLGRHVSCHRASAPPYVQPSARLEQRLCHHGSGRCRGLAPSDSHRFPIASRPDTISAEGHAAGHLLPLRQHQRALGTDAARALSLVLQDHQPDIKQVFQEYGRRKAERQLLDYDDLLLYWDQALRSPASRMPLPAAFSMCSSMNTRTPTRCRRRSLRKMWVRMQSATPPAHPTLSPDESGRG